MENDRIRQLMRAWMAQRWGHPEPLPSLEQIRRAVGWAEDAPPQVDAAAHRGPMTPVGA